MNSGSAFNTAEAEKYKEVTSQLANIFPDLVTGETVMVRKWPVIKK